MIRTASLRFQSLAPWMTALTFAAVPPAHGDQVLHVLPEGGEAPRQDRAAAVPSAPREDHEKTGETAAPPETTKIFTEDAHTVDPGATELELGYVYRNVRGMLCPSGRPKEIGDLKIQRFAFRVTHGFLDGLEAAVGVSWNSVISDEDDAFSEGVGNVTVNAKWRLFRTDNDTVTLSYLPGFTAPFANSVPGGKGAPGQRAWSIDQLLALTVAGARLNGSADAGFALPLGEERGDSRGLLVSDAAVGYQVLPWLQPAVELNYGHLFEGKGGDADLLAVTLGVILNVLDPLRIDLGVQQGLYSRNVECETAALVNISCTF